MKNAIVLLFIFTLATLNAQTENQEGMPPVMENNSDSMSYFLGLSLGYSLGSAPFEADLDLIFNGLQHVQDGTATHDQMSVRDILNGLQQALTQKENAAAQVQADENLEKGKIYLAENAERKEVKVTESGLQYEVITPGDGPMPADTSNVTVHYEGTLIDGTVFDSSYERGEPISFPLSGVIPGWTEGLQLMPVGSTYKLYIPADLGYGPRGSGPIPGNSTLVFKIELIGIE